MKQFLAHSFSTAGLKPPGTWTKPSILLSSLAINILALGLPMVILQIYDRIIPNQAVGTFTFLIIGLVGVVILDTALKIFRSIILSWNGAKFDHAESMKAMDKILHADNSEFEKNPPGYYLDKIYALEQIQEFYSGQSVLLIMDLPFVVLFLALISIIAGPMVLIPIALLLVFAVVAAITGKKLRRALETKYSTEDRRQNFIIETLNGIHTIKSMAMEALMMRRYERLQQQSADSVYNLSRINSIVQGVGATFSQLAVVIFIGIGSTLVIAGDLSIGALAAGSMLSSRVLQPGLKAMGFWTQFQSFQLALGKVKSLYAMKQEGQGSLNKKMDLGGAIELRGIRFKHPEQKQPLLNDISLTIKPGEAIGITGSNGAGKSTLINLLSGFLYPDEGQILLDGRDINDYNLGYLRSQIGIVPQNGILFEGTILENLTLYREGEAIVDALNLAKLLGLEKIITRLPEGLDTQVGGSAVDTLSEGVRQKIVLIRSLIGHPKILLFDDANANFDLQNDSHLLQLLLSLKGSRTMIIVSHRPSFLRICDRQLRLQAGQLIDHIDPFSNSNSVAGIKPKPPEKASSDHMEAG